MTFCSAFGFFMRTMLDRSSKEGIELSMLWLQGHYDSLNSRAGTCGKE